MKLINETIQEEIIDKLDNVLIIESVQPVINDAQAVTFCCLKWLKLYNFVTLNGVQYPCVSVNVNTKTVVFDMPTGADAFTVFDEPTLNRPLLLNGTLKNATEEWANLSLNEREKLPFLWLVSPTLERLAPLDSGLWKTSDVKLWFVHWSDWTQKNITRQAEAIKPLMALIQSFTDAIDENSVTFEGYEGVDLRDFPKFGTLNEKGIDKVIFPSTLSAVEFDISLKLFRKYCEKC
jgi:hypothetical protein